MNQILFVSGLESLRHIMCDAEDLFLIQSPVLCDDFFEARRIDKLHRDKKVSLILPNGVDLDYVGVQNRSGQLCLSFEHRRECAVLTQSLVKDFQCHLPLEVHVHRTENLTHSSRTQNAGDLVLSHASTHSNARTTVRAYHFRKRRKGSDID